MERPKKASTDRLEAFSDGIFAVALTLLILDVRVPDSKAALISQLTKLVPHIYAFVLSFSIVTLYWTAHHVVFNVIVRSDRQSAAIEQVKEHACPSGLGHCARELRDVRIVGRCGCPGRPCGSSA